MFIFIMPKKLISEQQVINAAKLLVSSGKSLTLAAIRMHLGSSGSDSTIHKYLKKWKQKCFERDTNQQNLSELHNKYIEEKEHLEQNLNKQVVQNEYYVQELINIEKINIALKEKINHLQTANQELQLKLTVAETTNNALEQVTQKIQNKLDLNTNATIQKMQQTIDGLKVELKKINEISIEALREASTRGHELLMQEKVTSINLQAKVDNLHKEVIDSKKQLYDLQLKNQTQKQTLLRQIDWQQKIIKNHVGFEKLRELIGEQEVMLHFNNKSGVAHGK